MRHERKLSRPAEKRSSMIADRYLAARPNTWQFDDATLSRVRRGILRARRFVLDEEAARKIAHIVMTIPELLAREHLFARAPYETTLIEWPSWHYWMEFYNKSPDVYAAQGRFGDPETADYSVAYLIDHDCVNVLTGGTKVNPEHSGYLMPIQYRLRTEWSVQDQIDFAEAAAISRRGIDTFFWGSTAEHLKGEDELRSLRATCAAEILPTGTMGPYKPGSLHGLIDGSIGDLRTIIALLLVMNRPGITRYVRDVPMSRGWINHKPKPFLSHTTVTIQIDPVPVLKLIGTPAGDGVPRRRHEVRGHYRHRRGDRFRGCQHDWLATDDGWSATDDTLGAEHWVCQGCETKRYWVAEHKRGKASGFIVHDPYEVTA